MVKIFGDKYTTRSFQEVEVISEFLPESSFSKLKGVSVPGATFTPGFILLLSYLEQLSSYDPFFLSQYAELNEILSFPRDRGMTSKPVTTDGLWIFPLVQTNAREMHRIENDAPASESTHLKSLYDIDVKVREYHFYDTDNNPVTFYVMNSYPLSRLMDYMAKEERENLQDFSLDHSLYVTEDNEAGIENMMDKPQLPVVSKGMSHPAQSIFKVSQNIWDGKASFSAQLSDEQKSDEPGENLLPQSLLATGSHAIEEPENYEPIDEFGFSDVMIGYVFDEVDFEREIPFLVSIDNKLPKFSNLFLHFQTVNLSLNSEGRSNLSIELSVQEKRRGLGIFRRSRKNSVTASYQGNTRQIRESFEFELVDREPGNYELTISFTDVNAGITETKKIPFELVDTE